MTVRPLATNNRTAGYQVTDEDNDLGTGAPIVPTTVSGINAILTGYTDPAARYQSFAVDDIIIAEDTGRVWRVGRDDTDAKVLFLLLEGTGGSGVASGPDIVLVVADKGGKYAGFGMSAAVYSTLPAAVAALPVGGGTIILLDDTYTLASPLPLPTNTRLFAFARGGVTITSPSATATLQPAGNLRLTNVSVANSGGGIPVQPSAGGDHYYDGAQVSGVSVLSTAFAIQLTAVNNTAVGSYEGGTGVCTLLSISSSFDTVSLPQSGSTVQAKNSDLLVIDCNGTVLLEQGTAQEIGAQTPPTTLTAVGTRFTGTAYDAQVMVLRSCVSDQGSAQFNTTVGSISAANCDFDATSTLTSNTDITVSNSRAPNINCSNGLFNVTSTAVSGTVVAVDVVAGKSSFANSVTASGSASFVESTISGAVSAPTVFSLRAGSRCIGKITLGAGATATVEQSTVQVTTATSGGAIVMNGGTLNLVDCYVRANDTLVSVSGTGTVNTTRGVSGGCRFANTLTIGTSTSGVESNNVSPASNLSANNTIAGITGTNQVYDTVQVNPTAGGFTLAVYDAGEFPIGFRFRFYNVNFSGGFGFNAVPTGSDTINGATAAITVGPGNYLEFEKVATGAWVTY